MGYLLLLTDVYDTLKRVVNGNQMNLQKGFIPNGDQNMANFDSFASTNTIRSSFCADGVRAGTRVFLLDMGDKFLVASRFQNIGYRKGLDSAIALFERTLVGA
jgi:hypothetical protein